MHRMNRLSIAAGWRRPARTVQTPEQPLGFLDEGVPGRVARAGLGLILPKSDGPAVQDGVRHTRQQVAEEGAEVDGWIGGLSVAETVELVGQEIRISWKRASESP